MDNPHHRASYQHFFLFSAVACVFFSGFLDAVTKPEPIFLDLWPHIKDKETSKPSESSGSHHLALAIDVFADMQSEKHIDTYIMMSIYIYIHTCKGSGVTSHQCVCYWLHVLGQSFASLPSCSLLPVNDSENGAPKF